MPRRERDWLSWTNSSGRSPWSARYRGVEGPGEESSVVVVRGGEKHQHSAERHLACLHERLVGRPGGNVMGSVSCRFCRADTGDIVLDLGLQPACEYFPALDDPTVDPVFPLRLWLCSACGLAQLADDADVPEQPEGVEPAALTRQRIDAVATAHAADLLPVGATLAEGATPHGGSWRVALEKLGLRTAAPGVPADVVIDGSFGMMHAADQSSALEALVDRLAPDGVLILQFHSLAAILRERQWNAVRLGHYAYYSAPALQRMLAGPRPHRHPRLEILALRRHRHDRSATWRHHGSVCHGDRCRGARRRRARPRIAE